MKNLEIKHLGLIDYDEAMALMADLHGKRCLNQMADTILVLEHHPVITKGRRIHSERIPFEDKIESQGIQIRPANRGGLLTYHGPGQIVVYFVLRLEDHFDGVSSFVCHLERCLQAFLKQNFAIESRVDPDHPGIWVGPQKIASLGLRVSQGVTSHGVALNVSNDLSVYQLFSPCGLSSQTMTNLESILKTSLDKTEFEKISDHLGESFGISLRIKN